ncbi:MBL fold metallo-hydrolase [Denitrobaculum tricleocarpae]|uniref:MBL fold metallo-hydrolase n=1 Tax=Denitrobaculum tricleocarpae TaxID=2591009 RepID=A0A545T062_9PROT|nr:MBL fold metallo-hydrolase [Denitrobaculum tricleocarpae]TQV70614.1 MBL fold metallo-hydrolase [Denitrobaculum tricleocarpae]
MFRFGLPVGFLVGLPVGVLAGLAFTLAAVLTPNTAQASKCFAYVEQVPEFQPSPSSAPGFIPAAFSAAQLAPSVQITYVTHSTFRLETPEGVVIATDYAGFAGAGVVPTVVTMNHAHETHYTAFPDPAIRHVLRGWNPQGGPAKHNLTVEDVLIRNVPTDIRRWDGGAERDGNSIFIFEVADLCIGHLGHLHHKPTPEQLAMIGRLDVVFAPVDGSYTLDLPTMIELLKELRASLVIPMHSFSDSSLRLFLAGMLSDFELDMAKDATIEISLTTLPRQPTVLVLPGR